MAVIGFKTEYPKENAYRRWADKTGFPEAVLSSQYSSADEIPEEYKLEADDDRIAYWKVGRLVPKLHTIRRKNKSRKVGGKLHPSIGVRTKQQHQFCPELEIKGLQDLKIKWGTDKVGRPRCDVYVDGKLFGFAKWSGNLMTYISDPLKRLILADGFAFNALFFQWFNTNGTYQIIHWTDLRYKAKKNEL